MKPNLIVDEEIKLFENTMALHGIIQHYTS